MTNEELKNMPYIIDTLLDEAITDSTRQKVKDKLTEVCQLATNALDQRWIPVSKRLPKFTADYKVTVGINYDGGGMFPEVRIALYNKVYKCWVVYESDRAIVGDVIAWMPLPEAYKAESDKESEE